MASTSITQSLLPGLAPNETVAPDSVEVTVLYSVAPFWLLTPFDAIRVYPEAAVSLVVVPRYPTKPMIMSLALDVETPVTLGVPEVDVRWYGRPLWVSNGEAVCAPDIP